MTFGDIEYVDTPATVIRILDMFVDLPGKERTSKTIIGKIMINIKATCLALFQDERDFCLDLCTNYSRWLWMVNLRLYVA